MQFNTLVNKGAFVRQGPPLADGAGKGRTFIISGVGRGGTTLVAEVLREAGINLGEQLSELVAEDLDMLRTLRSKDAGKLDHLIASRNEAQADWGFKVPNIHIFLRHSDLARFRNPHLILIFRDPQAIAARNALAEYFEPLTALRDATVALNALAEFVHLTVCPSLLLSYEKALLFPDDFIDALVGFCAMPVDEQNRQRLLAHVRPNAEPYVSRARRSYTGSVDHVRAGIVSGWCCEVGELAPVDLDLFLNEEKVMTFRADRFRPDLVKAGFGNGNHAFAIQLPTPQIDLSAVLRVRLANRSFELSHSGRCVFEYQRP